MQSDLPQPEKFTSFFEWLWEEGAEFDKAELRQESENMRGIFADQDVSKGKTLIFVKIDQIITKTSQSLRDHARSQMVHMGAQQR